VHNTANQTIIFPILLFNPTGCVNIAIP